MNESERLRRDPVTGKLVVFAPERRQPPDRMHAELLRDDVQGCPFCPGNERQTPPEVDAVRAPGSRADAPGWLVRVVPNRYPAFPGGHEVIIHSPDHDRALEDLDEKAAAMVVEMYRRRLSAQLDRGAVAVTIICNRGAEAGASQQHPHSQVFALPAVPPQQVEELANFERYRNRYGDCLLCSEMERARREGRVVTDGEVVAWVPRAARWGYELWLAPRRHQADFRDADATATSSALRASLRATTAAAEGAPLNYWLHTSAPGHAGAYHWHFEMAPRITPPAGFELSTDMTIVGLEPYVAAERLRRALAD